MRINLKDIEKSVKPLSKQDSYDKEFIFSLLLAYGRSSSSISRLRIGQLNVAEDKNLEIAQKGVLYFKPTSDNLYAVIDELRSSSIIVRFSIRFVIVTDYDKLLAVDTKTGETLDIDVSEIDKHFTFFLPWAGMEKAQYVAENHADVRAAEKMAKLFDEIVACNHFTSSQEWHALNVFFTRLLFCFFAEDTNIFSKGQFTNAIASYTQPDGSDLHDLLTELFTSLDIDDKTGYPAHIAAFPYVNGRLFRTTQELPVFNKKARELMIECGGQLDWSNINPDIFGSMIQAVVNPGQRAGLGMHYTSVPNIMKTIEPLFLDRLKYDFNINFDNPVKLAKLLVRISAIKVFDPACGSGNFLIIAYKELRKLEHAIIERQNELTGQSQQTLLGSRISIENFYGIEIDDFAHEVAILSLWLAKHQMNLEFAEKFGIDLPLIPLKEAGNIVRANALRTDWRKVCPINPTDEVYLIGNPPYLGAKVQDISQKKDYTFVFGDEPYSKNLDYIALWFIKGAHYITNTEAQLAFVTTNSVAQGEHVGLMFPKIFELGLEIGFAYTSFKWENNAKHNAGVIVAVINLRSVQDKPKYIWTNNIQTEVRNINGYLADGASDIVIERRKEQISGLPAMVFGSMPRDGGALILSSKEKNALIAEYPEAEQYVKKYLGSAEYIRGEIRYCLWITDSQADAANEIPFIHERLIQVTRSRKDSDAKSTKEYASKPYRFVQVSYQPTESIAIPAISSERREYIPVGYLDKDTVVSNKIFAVYNAEPYIFGLLSSKMHMAWVRTVAGRLKNDFNYSSTITYNNFPSPTLTQEKRDTIEEKVFKVLDAREIHSEKTLAELYDPDKMPENLRIAHQDLDDVVDKAYRDKDFSNDEDRLAHLFDLYEIMAKSKGDKND